MTDYERIIDSLNLNKVSIMSVESEDGHDLVTIKGGLNGRGDFLFYISQVDKIVYRLCTDNREVWLVSWINDCIDDVWYLKLGVRNK